MISQRVKHRWYAAYIDCVDRAFLFFVLGVLMLVQVTIAAQVFPEDAKQALDSLVMGWSIHEILVGTLMIWVFLPFIRAGVYTGYYYYKHGTLVEPQGETA